MPNIITGNESRSAWTFAISLSLAVAASLNPAFSDSGPKRAKSSFSSPSASPSHNNEAKRKQLEQEDSNDSDALVQNRPFQFGQFRFRSLVRQSAGWDIPTGVQVWRDKRLILTVPNKRVDNSREYVHYWLAFPRLEPNYRRTNQFSDNDLARAVMLQSKRSRDPFIDITGDGIRDVIVIGWRGGIHTGYDYIVYSLGAKPHKYDILHGGDGPFTFAHLDRDRKYQAIGRDWTFAYWHTSFAGSPAPLIILTPGVHSFEVATKFMKTRPASSSVLAKMARECRAEIKLTQCPCMKHVPKRPVYTMPSVVWRHMLDLIFTGNSKQAWLLLNEVWPHDGVADWYYERVGTKEEFRRDFLAQLSTSPYWKGVQSLNPTDTLLHRRIGHQRPYNSSI